jgi:hypothetical protein
MATPPLRLLAHPRFGVGGERSETEGGWLPQEAIKMALHTSKGRLPPFIIYNSPFTIFKRPPSTTTAVPLPPRWEACHWILSRLLTPYESSSLATASGGRQGFQKKGTPPLRLLVHPRLGVGGERSETEGGGRHPTADSGQPIADSRH